MANDWLCGSGSYGQPHGEAAADPPGHSVTGYNRTQAKAQWLIGRGHEIGRDAARRGPGAEITFYDGDQYRGIARGHERAGRYTSGLVRRQDLCRHEHREPRCKPRSWPDRLKRRAPRCSMRRFLAVSITFEEGKLSFMVGGKREIFEKVLPILHAIGPKVTYVGGHGLAVVHENRNQFEPSRADAGLQRRCAAR